MVVSVYGLCCDGLFKAWKLAFSSQATTVARAKKEGESKMQNQREWWRWLKHCWGKKREEQKHLDDVWRRDDALNQVVGGIFSLTIRPFHHIISTHSRRRGNLEWFSDRRMKHMKKGEIWGQFLVNSHVPINLLQNVEEFTWREKLCGKKSFRNWIRPSAILCKILCNSTPLESWLLSKRVPELKFQWNCQNPNKISTSSVTVQILTLSAKFSVIVAAVCRFSIVDPFNLQNFTKLVCLKIKIQLIKMRRKTLNL